MASSDNFKDQARINKVREVLWGRSTNGASVMVGSGFSKNAQARLRSAFQMPNWMELAAEMRLELHTTQAEEGESGSHRAIDPLKIAQDYCNEFGRAELHRFLRQRIRDEEVEPSRFHVRLLELPWSDVFTTNWDTLLERTARHVVTPNYGVVKVPDEIPLVARPRIVKLHGSLPANFPLVATASDYEKYPDESAAFVNTVQQAMMESVLLLIGFSGTDPNFIRWTDWVRERLGESAPKIYIAGWLDLDETKRRKFEDRQIMPIDLAQHPSGEEWRTKRRKHEFASDWILSSLLAGQPYPNEEWPKVLTPHSEFQEYLEPIDRSAWNAPKESIEIVVNAWDEQISEADVLEVVANWKHNRELYPGWLTLPERTRQDLLSTASLEYRSDLLRTDLENDILDSTKGYSLRTRLDVLHEIVWRREVRLEPLGDSLTIAIEDILRRFTSLSEEEQKDETLGSLTIPVALALVTQKRLNFDMEGFHKSVEWTESMTSIDIESSHRIRYENCLMALYMLDREELPKLLDEWDVRSGDPIWKVRKAGLLFESSHRREEAQPLIREAIADFRDAKRDDSEISILSREAWAIYIANAMDSSILGGRNNPLSSSSRSRDLARVNCDPESDIRILTNNIQESKFIETESKPEFDLGRGAATTLPFQSSDIESPARTRARIAFRVIRMTELVGLPSLVGARGRLANYMLGKASEAFSNVGETELGLRLMLRVASSSLDDILKNLMSRQKIAVLSDDIVKSLVDSCERLIRNHQAGRIERPKNDHIFSESERIDVAIECLSRLVLRLDVESVGRTLRLALDCYREGSRYADMPIRIALRNLFLRSWEALPNDACTNYIFDLLNAPVVGLDGFALDSNFIIEPIELIEKRDVNLPPRDTDNEMSWLRTVEYLIRGLAGGKETQWRTVLRLIHVAEAGCLLEAEKDRIASTIWPLTDGQRKSPIGEENFRPWVYFRLPEPTSGVASRWFREKWLLRDNDEKDPQWLNKALYALGDTMERSEFMDLGLEFSDDDRAVITDLMVRWSRQRVPKSVMDFDLSGSWHETTYNAIRGVSFLLMYVRISEDLVHELQSKCEWLQECRFSPLNLIVGLSKCQSNLRESAVAAVREALFADDPETVKGATSSLLFWLHFANLNRLQEPPDGLIREIGAIVEMRRTVELQSILLIVEWILDSDWKRQQDLLNGPVIQGLERLLPMLRYEELEQSDSTLDVPLLRARCVEVARALKRSGQEHECITAWIEEGLSDKLPETRQ